MEVANAALLLNGEVMFPSIVVTFNPPTPDHTGLLTTWSGSFELPPGLPDALFVKFWNRRRDTCTLHFDDGRKGDILMNANPMSRTVPFKGAGGLSRAE